MNRIKILAKIKARFHLSVFQGTFTKGAADISGPKEVILSEYLIKMDKTSAKRLLDETFKNDFDSHRFPRFIKQVFNDFTFAEKTVHIWNEYNDYIANCFSIGNYIDDSKNTIDVLTVKLKKTSSRDRARTMQRNFVAKYPTATQIQMLLL